MRHLLGILMVGVVLVSACSSQSPLGPTQDSGTEKAAEAQPRTLGTIVLEGGTWTLENLAFERIFFTPSGNAHARHLVSRMEIAGDLAGTGELIQEQININARGNGSNSGEMALSVSLETEAGTLSGGFFSRYAVDIHSGWIDTVTILDGSDGFEGMTLYFRSVGPTGGPYNWTGYIETE